MDEDFKKTLIFGTLSAIFGGGLYYFNKKLQDLDSKRKMLTEQGVCYTPSTLERKRQLFRDTGAPRFGVVNGICLTNSHAKSLDKMPSGDKKIYKVNYEVELSTSNVAPKHIDSLDK